MIDPTPFEIEAFYHASVMAGEYLESIKKTDLVTLTPNEWDTFIVVVCTGYSDSLHQAHHRLEEDLARVREVFAPPEPPF